MTVTPVVLPDRRHVSPESGVGFDTIGVTGPTDMSCINELQRIWHKRTTIEETGEIRDSPPGGSSWIDVGQTRAKVVVDVDRSTKATMRVEVSAPHMLHGHNWDGIGLDHLSTTVKYLLDSVSESLPDVPSLDQIRVTRLDLTRDFHEVRDPSATLGAIAKHRVPHATVEDRHLIPADLRHQTVVRGNANYWRVRGYDKVHEMLRTGRAAEQQSVHGIASQRPTQLRFELQLRSKELRRRSLTTLQSLMLADLSALARHYFDRCRFDVNTAETGAAEILRQLTEDGVTAAEQRNLLVYLTCQRYGTEPLLSRNSRDRSRALANRYRLGPDSLGATTFTRRLDFDLGREVVK